MLGGMVMSPVLEASSDELVLPCEPEPDTETESYPAAESETKADSESKAEKVGDPINVSSSSEIGR